MILGSALESLIAFSTMPAPWGLPEDVWKAHPHTNTCYPRWC